MENLGKLDPSGVTMKFGRTGQGASKVIEGTLLPAAQLVNVPGGSPLHQRGFAHKMPDISRLKKSGIISEHSVQQLGTGGLTSIETSKATVEMPPISMKEQMQYRSIPPQNMTIDITTKRSLTISEQPEELPKHRESSQSPKRDTHSPLRGYMQQKPSTSSVIPGEERGSNLQDKRFSRVLRSQGKRSSPQSLRGHTAIASSDKQSLVLELSREQQSMNQSMRVNKKYRDVRSKLEGYHDPVALLKKVKELEKMIEQQKQQVTELKEINKGLKVENERSKDVNRKLFEEMTNAEDERRARGTLHDMSASTMLQPSTLRMGESLSTMNPANHSFAATTNHALPQITTAGRTSKTQTHNRVATFGELQNIYQDLFLTDMKKEMSRAQDQLSVFQEQNSSAQEQISYLRSNNQTLTSTVRRYKKMMHDLQTISSRKNAHTLLAHIEESDTRSMHSDPAESLFGGGERGPLSFAPSISLQDRGRSNIHQSAHILDAKRLEHFQHTISLLSKDNLVLMDILVTFLQELKTILKCSGVNAFIFDQHFSTLLRQQGLRRKDQALTHLQKLYFEKDWIDVVCINEKEFHEPAFNVIDDVREGLLSPQALVMPVTAFAQVDVQNSDQALRGEMESMLQTQSNFSTITTKRQRQEHIWLGIQCTGKGEERGKRQKKTGFHRVDELLLRVLCNWLSQRLQVYITKKENKAKEKVVQSAIEITSNITVQKTHKHMFNTMRKLLPSFFGFEDCSVLAYNSDTRDLFTVSDSSEETAAPSIAGHRGSAGSAATDDKKSVASRVKTARQKKDSLSAFSSSKIQEAANTRINQSLIEMGSHVQEHEIIAFPSSIGATGHVFNNKTIYFSNKPEKDAKWNPDIDNLSTVVSVSNFLIGVLLDQKGEPIGVLQLVNKNDSKKISTLDVQRFQKMRTFLGVCFENTDITHQTLTVTLGVKEVMGEVLRQFETYQTEVRLRETVQNELLGVNPIVALEKHVELLRRKLTDLNERRN